MKALSIKPTPALAIITGEKLQEFRTWQTEYRGDLLICATAKKTRGAIAGHALGVVTLTMIEHLSAGNYAWHLENIRLIQPFPVKGKLSLYEVADEQISWPHGTPQQIWQTYYEPLID